ESLVSAQTRRGQRGRGAIEVDVVGRKKVEPAIAVVVEKRAPCSPANLVARHSRGARDVLESAVSLVAIEAILPPIRDEEIIPAVVVIVADACGLPPATGANARTRRDVLERAVAAIAIEVIRRLLT